MTDDDKIKLVQSSEATLPPSANPDLARQMLMAAQSGDPNKALDALVGVGVLSPEARAGMIAEAQREKDGMMRIAAQVAQNTEAVRFMAHAIDNFQNALNALRGDMDLLKRAWKRVPAFAEALEKLEADRMEKLRVLIEQAKKVKATSTVSKDVTTSKP